MTRRDRLSDEGRHRGFESTRNGSRPRFAKWAGRRVASEGRSGCQQHDAGRNSAHPLLMIKVSWTSSGRRRGPHTAIKRAYLPTHRKPALLFRLTGVSAARRDTRKFLGGLLHEPPRATRNVPADGPVGSRLSRCKSYLASYQL
jgi:hypothetical protein